MIITRKIQIFVCEDDKDLRKEYYEKLYNNRNVAVKVANMAVSHEFALDHTMPYLTEESRKQIQFIGCRGKEVTRRNAPYVAASEAFKGTGVDMGMVSCVLSNVQKMYQSDSKIDPKNGKRGFWDKSLRSYKENMPVPFKTDRFVNLRLVEMTSVSGKKYEGGFFSLMGVPFQMRFGKDRSGNRIIVERILQQLRYEEQQQGIEHKLLPREKEIEPVNTNYKFCTSSIAFEKKYDEKKDKKVSKIFLYLCADIPVQQVEVNPKKAVYAYLGINHPIQCLIDAQNENVLAKDNWIDIGTAEEFFYRRTQIQAALKRTQENSKYAKGGKGRKRKLQAVIRFEEKERNYVDTKLHLYSKQLVDIAVNNGCGIIYLVNQKPREDEAKKEAEKGNPLVLRNWSYYNLKQKIDYKCKKYGIQCKELGKKQAEEDDEE